jgi:hypothetical protein
VIGKADSYDDSKLQEIKLRFSLNTKTYGVEFFDCESPIKDLAINVKTYLTITIYCIVD